MSKIFKDSAGRVGWPREAASFTFTKLRKQKIRFEVINPDYLQLIIPDYKPILVTRKNAVKLAHWILSSELLSNT